MTGKHVTEKRREYIREKAREQAERDGGKTATRDWRVLGRGGRDEGRKNTENESKLKLYTNPPT